VKVAFDLFHCQANAIVGKALVRFQLVGYLRPDPEDDIRSLPFQGFQ
jgi:hypothetical protein